MILHVDMVLPVSRHIIQEKETLFKTSPLGTLLLYTKDSYAKTHNREAVDDGLKLEQMTFPNGSTGQGVKAG